MRTGLVEGSLSVTRPAWRPRWRLGGVGVSGSSPAWVRLWADGVLTWSPASVPSSGPPVAAPAGSRKFRVRRRAVRAAGYALFHASRRVLLVTLTFPASVSEYERVQRIRSFARWLSVESARTDRRRAVTGYVWVLERHLSGALHAHFLVGLAGWRKLWVTSLAQASVRWTGSINGLDVRYVKGGLRAVTAYVSKYVSKSQNAVFSTRAYGFGGVARYHVRSLPFAFCCFGYGGAVVGANSYYAPAYALFDCVLRAAAGSLFPAAWSGVAYEVSERGAVGVDYHFLSPPPPAPQGAVIPAE